METQAQAAQAGAQDAPEDTSAATGAQDAPDPQGDTQSAANKTQPEAGQAPAATSTSVSELPDWAQEMVKSLREENAKHRHAKKAAEQATAQAEEAKLVEQQKWQELADKRAKELEEIKGELESVRLDALRREVGTEVGLPSKLVVKISGGDRDEMLADAQEMLEALPKQQAPNDAQHGAGGAPSGGMSDAEKAEFAAIYGVRPEYIP